MPSTIQRLTVESAAWVSLPSPRRAVLRATVTTEGMSESIVLDLCRELADRLPWAVVGDTVFPEDTLPRGVMTDSAESVAGGLRIETDPNQGSPEYSDGTAEPGGCPAGS